MMNNLFSIFDPSVNSMIWNNWMSSWLILLMVPCTYYYNKSRLSIIIMFIYYVLFIETMIIFKKKFNLMNSILVTNLFIMIFMNNMYGLFPYIFTSSSHLIFSMSMSFPLWIGLMLFGWINNTNFMFSHLIPQGTPAILMPFMVLIETISNMIRPLTLAVRLTANIIAGHLLVTLLSQSACNSFYIFINLIIFIQILLLILEFSVSIIQSYVFMILSTLYTKETN